jgi:hypothetical protein
VRKTTDGWLFVKSALTILVYVTFRPARIQAPDACHAGLTRGWRYWPHSVNAIHRSVLLHYAARSVWSAAALTLCLTICDSWCSAGNGKYCNRCNPGLAKITLFRGSQEDTTHPQIFLKTKCLPPAKYQANRPWNLQTNANPPSK